MHLRKNIKTVKNINNRDKYYCEDFFSRINYDQYSSENVWTVCFENVISSSIIINQKKFQIILPATLYLFLPLSYFSSWFNRIPICVNFKARAVIFLSVHFCQNHQILLLHLYRFFIETNKLLLFTTVYYSNIFALYKRLFFNEWHICTFKLS